MQPSTCTRIFRNTVVARQFLSFQRCRSLSYTYKAGDLTYATLGQNRDRGKDEVEAFRRHQSMPFYDQSDQLIDLWRDHPREQIGVLPLRDVLLRHVKPGSYLAPQKGFVQSIEETTLSPRYLLRDFDTLDYPHKLNRRVLGTSAKQVLFSIWKSQNLDHFAESMHSAFHYLKSGKKVEIHLHKRAKEKHTLMDLLESHIHLRPDVILQAMPSYSGIIIQPQTNYKTCCCWTMAGPHRYRDGTIEMPNDQTYRLHKRRLELFGQDAAGQQQNQEATGQDEHQVVEKSADQQATKDPNRQDQTHRTDVELLEGIRKIQRKVSRGASHAGLTYLKGISRASRSAP